MNKEQTIRINNVDEDNQNTHPLYHSGHVRYVKIINDPVFYALLTTSKSDYAKRFQKWVSLSEVLPSIRTYGYCKLFDNPFNHNCLYAIGL